MTTEKIDNILQAVYQRVQKLIPSERFYTILYNAQKGNLSFPLVIERDQFLPKGQSTWVERPYEPENFLPDRIIAYGTSSLYQEDIKVKLEDEKIYYWPGKLLPRAWLGMPLSISGQVIGALVLENWQKSEPFTGNDEQVLATIARQTATAIENARLHQQLERKIENLRILNHVGQQLTRGIGKEEHEILDLVYQSATELQIDTRNMYIAFYEADPDRPDTKNDVNGILRFVLLLDRGKPRQEVSHPAKEGLSGYVIRTKKSFNPPNTKKAYQEYVPERTKKIYQSWLGVPMLSDDRVFGVIVMRNDDFEQVYTPDDQEILELLAGQTAVALQNLRLYQAQQQAQEQKMAAENMAIMSLVGAEFAHKMNNLAGTIPLRINMVKLLLDTNNPKNAKVIEGLNKIEGEAYWLLNAARDIRESSAKAAKERVDINQLLEMAITRAKTSQINKNNDIEIITDLSEDLHRIIAEKNSLLDALTSIIKNGCEAIEQKGQINITTQNGEFNGRNVIEIKIKDTGKGIPTSDLPKIFDLFYTTKGGRGLGFGLWRDRIFIKQLGGEIDIQSTANKGSTFTIRIPVKQNIGN